MNAYKHIKTSIAGALLLTGCLISFGIADETQRVTTSGQPWETLQAVQATPMQVHEMHAVRGKNTGENILRFLQTQAQSVQPGLGVTIWGFSSDGNRFTASATWNTGSSSGNGTLQPR